MNTKRQADLLVHGIDWLISVDAIAALRELKAGGVDVVLCLGFFYHTLEHMRLLLEARRLGAEYVIVDTSISPAPFMR